MPPVLVRFDLRLAAGGWDLVIADKSWRSLLIKVEKNDCLSVKACDKLCFVIFGFLIAITSEKIVIADETLTSMVRILAILDILITEPVTKSRKKQENGSLLEGNKLLL